jgi:hypothetical protein
MMEIINQTIPPTIKPMPYAGYDQTSSVSSMIPPTIDTKLIINPIMNNMVAKIFTTDSAIGLTL